jgi:hypothetical protein
VPTAMEQEQIKKIAIQVVKEYSNVNVRGNFKEINLYGTPEQILFQEIKAIFHKQYSEKYNGMVHRSQIDTKARMRAVSIMMKYLQDNKPDHPAIN